MTKFQIFVTCAALSGALAQAATFNAVTDFSLAGNPNGVWSYGTSTGGADFSLLTVSESNAGLLYWERAPLSNPFPDYYPRFIRNTGANIVSGNYTIYSDSLEMAATSFLDVILRFTAPTAGTYMFTGDFRGSQGPFQSSVGTTVLVSASAGGSNVIAPTALNGTSTVGINFSRVLAAGEVAAFRVSSPGDFTGDTVALRLAVDSQVASTVPEPSTLMLSGGALAALAALRRRR